MTDSIAARRADIDAKQALLAEMIAELGCEAAILLVPAHSAWFTGGLNLRGLFAEAERPGIYTTGKMRWLICGNVDTQRLFDEELDGLGFMVKEWNWSTGRALLLAELVAGKKVASDRPFPGLPQLVERLRTAIRPLHPFDEHRYRELGGIVSHALEATARGFTRGDSEREIAGQLAHRVLHKGAEVHSLSVIADTRGEKFRRAGFTETPAEWGCTLQLTAVRHGMHVTASRTVSFGPPSEEFRQAYEAACKLAAIFRAGAKPDSTLGAAVETGFTWLKHSPYEHQWRLSPPVFGTGWVAAEELRRSGHDEPFQDRQPLVWQARLGPASVVDTALVTPHGADAMTPPNDWPYKRITMGMQTQEIADLLIRPTESVESG